MNASRRAASPARGRDGSSHNASEESRLGAMTGSLETNQVKELLCQALETEIGGVQIYETAIRCAQNEELREEWQKYLEETRNHERILREVFETIGLDAGTDTPGRDVVRHNGEALVAAMEMALDAGDEGGAQLVAAECVVLAETKDHFNWELIGEIATKVEGALRTSLKHAHEEVEDQEDEHLYHTRGWARELWFEAFGLPAKLPPPEETQKIKTELASARIQKQRKAAVKRGRATRRSAKAVSGRGRSKG